MDFVESSSVFTQTSVLRWSQGFGLSISLVKWVTIALTLNSKVAQR